MKQKTQEEMYASLQRGMQASQDLGIVLPLLAERREGLIASAIANYNARDPESGKRKYDGLDALLFVAALAENQRLVDDLLHAEKQGRRDGERLVAL